MGVEDKVIRCQQCLEYDKTTRPIVLNDKTIKRVCSNCHWDFYDDCERYEPTWDNDYCRRCGKIDELLAIPYENMWIHGYCKDCIDIIDKCGSNT